MENAEGTQGIQRGVYDRGRWRDCTQFPDAFDA